MKIRVAMLLKQHMIDYCKDNLGEYQDPFTIVYYAYETLDQLQELYKKIHMDFDGIITSGAIPHRMLTQIGKRDRIAFAHFRFDIENTYRILLTECMKRQEASLSRVGIDFLDDQSSLEQIIVENRLPVFVKEYEHKIASLPLDALDDFEEKLNQSYQQRYQEGKLDFIVTYFYSTVKKMEPAAIDCYYLYPSSYEIQYVMRTLEQQVLLEQSRMSHPAVIRIHFPNTSPDDIDMELYYTEIQKLLLEEAAEMQNSLSVKRGHQYFELYTDYQTIDVLTDHFRYCRLLPLLKSKISFHGGIGYGIGQDFYHARSNALEAAKLACNLHPREASSYLINENEQVTSLTDEYKETYWIQEIPKDYVRQVAAQAKLSPDTIYKIIGVLAAEGTNQITSTELIDRLSLSLRTANRYLSNLLKADLAKIVGQRAPEGKGRPVNIYQLGLEYWQ